MESEKFHFVLNSEQPFSKSVFFPRDTPSLVCEETIKALHIVHPQGASQYFKGKGLPLFTVIRHPLF